MKPRIAVTMGDPAGIGPEICLDLLADDAIADSCTPIVFGDIGILKRCAASTGRSATFPVIAAADIPQADTPAVVGFSEMDASSVTPGTSDARTGEASYRYLTEAIDACLRGEVQAMTTAPASKAALRAAGINHPGHTEILAERTGATSHCMMFYSDTLICSLVTIHVGLRDVPGLLTTEAIAETIALTRDAVARLTRPEPRLAVCGLNPHAGEGGLFGGGEEEQVITPAIQAARDQGWSVTGPLPPDTAFTVEARRKFDAYICMYHDQALIPLKALAFDRAVNVTLGLPIIRTSVDHGTAPDIAWQGRANPRSLREAVLLAARLATA